MSYKGTIGRVEREEKTKREGCFRLLVPRCS